MDLSKVLSITGKGGLFLLVSKGNNCFIVESLADGKRFPAFSHDGVANLENISIFTEDEDVTLQSVLQSIFKKENGGLCNVKMNDNNALKAYFAEVLPNYDTDRVRVSDMRKVLSWYNILTANGITEFESKEEENATDEQKTTEEEAPKQPTLQK